MTTETIPTVNALLTQPINDDFDIDDAVDSEAAAVTDRIEFLKCRGQHLVKSIRMEFIKHEKTRQDWVHWYFEMVTPDPNNLGPEMVSAGETYLRRFEMSKTYKDIFTDVQDLKRLIAAFHGDKQTSVGKNEIKGCCMSTQPLTGKLIWVIGVSARHPRMDPVTHLPLPGEDKKKTGELKEYVNQRYRQYFEGSVVTVNS